MTLVDLPISNLTHDRIFCVIHDQILFGTEAAHCQIIKKFQHVF